MLVSMPTNASSSLHVYAACSSEAAVGWRRERFERFERTMRVWALPFACVGRGERWRGFAAMASRYAAVAERVPPHDHVVMVDGADAFAQASATEVLAAFRRVASGRPLVLGLETGHTQWAHSLHCRPATGSSEAKRAWLRASLASQPHRSPQEPT